jgi:hypothetical protein
MSVIFVFHGEYLTVLQPAIVDQLFVVVEGGDWLRKTEIVITFVTIIKYMWKNIYNYN